MGRTSADGRSNVVRAARRRAGLTQAELAEQVGVTRQTIAAVEAGNYAPSVFLALDVAHRLGTSVESLFTPESTPESTPEPTPEPTLRAPAPHETRTT